MAVLPPGALVGGYRVEAVVGRGGMGVVYRARHLQLGRTAAVKVIAPELAADPAFRARFEREARAAAAVEHSAVLPVYEAGLRDGLLFLATRFAEGGDLRAALAGGGPATAELAVAVLEQVAAALDAAHAAGLLHRDVKTANVLLDGPLQPGVRAYLADFGLVSSSASQTQSASGHWRGTLDYVAPEQLKGDPVDRRSDVYSLGCVLYELLAGRPPYRRDNDVATLWAHIAEPPPPLPAQVEQADALGSVVRRALAKEPADRFPTAGALAAAARSALQAGTAAARVGAPDVRVEVRDGEAGAPVLPAGGWGAVPAGAVLPAAANALLVLVLGLWFSPGSYTLTTDQLQQFYVHARPAGFWLYVVLFVLAQGCLVAHSALLRQALRRRGGGLAADLMHRGFVLGVGLLLVTLTLRVLPTFRMAASGDVRALRLVYDAAVFLELLALAVLPAALAAAAVAARRAHAGAWAVWPAVLLTPLAGAGAVAALADPESVVLVDLTNGGLVVWVLASGLTVLHPPVRAAEPRPRRTAVSRRVRAGLVLMGVVAAGPVLHAWSYLADPARLDVVTSLEAAVGVASLGLVTAVWTGRRRPAVALYVLQVALALRVLRPAVWSLDGPVPAEAWVAAAQGGVLSALALALALPVLTSGAVSRRARWAGPWRRRRSTASGPPRAASGTPPESPRTG